MERYTKEQGVIFVKTHYKYGESYAETAKFVQLSVDEMHHISQQFKE
jgi:hypothetical protein